MPIDIGDIPTGTPPTTGEKLQIRTAIGLGQTDAPTFLTAALSSQGLANAPSLAIGTGAGYYQPTNTQISFSANGSEAIRFTGGGIRLGTNELGWGTFAINSLILARDADGILAQRNGTAKQVHRVYNTFLGTTANEWGGFDWLTTTNTLRIGTEHGGTGTARGIEFATGGVVNVNISPGGAFTVGRNGQAGSLGILNSTGSSNIQLSGTPGYGYHMAAPVLITWGNGTTLNGSLDTGLERNAPGTVGVNTGTAGTYGFLKAKLQTSTAYTGTVVAATGYITIYDSTGQAYRVPCVV
jgi:hypothetical protein